MSINELAAYVDSSGLKLDGIGRGLLILFIGLKLAGFIAWSWLWVVSPLWIYLGAWGVRVLLEKSGVERWLQNTGRD